MGQTSEILNLADIASIEISTEKSGVTRYDRIKFRFTSLYPIIKELTSWESDFIRSTMEQFNHKRDLTDPQFKTLLRIWQQAHADNFVKLPKGMV